MTNISPGGGTDGHSIDVVSAFSVKVTVNPCGRTPCGEFGFEVARVGGRERVVRPVRRDTSDTRGMVRHDQDRRIRFGPANGRDTLSQPRLVLPMKVEGIRRGELNRAGIVGGSHS